MSQTVCVKEIHCQSGIQEMWEVITDANRINWALGLHDVLVSPLSDNGAARFMTRAKFAGLPLTFEEEPYTFSYLQSFSVQRRLYRGLLTSVRLEFLPRPADSGTTDVLIRSRVQAGFAWLTPLIKNRSQTMLHQLAQSMLSADAALLRGAPQPSPTPPRIDDEELDATLQALARLETTEWASRFDTLFHYAADQAIARLRPFVWAAHWGASPQTTLKVCFSAVLAGLLNVQWDVLCPSCRLCAGSMPTPAMAPAQSFCQACDLTFEVDSEVDMEVIFTPNPLVRQVETLPGCVAGPAQTPHVVAQSVLPQRAVTTFHAPHKAGTYRIFVRGGAQTMLQVSAEGNPRLVLRSDELNCHATACVMPDASIEITNVENHATHAKVEHVKWQVPAAKAADVRALPGLQEQFFQPERNARPTRISAQSRHLT